MGSGVLRIGLFTNILLLATAFSVDAFALSCKGVKIFSDESNAAYIAEAPDSSGRYRWVGLQNYCAGNVEVGINYMEKSSDMGDILASRNMGLYYGSDKTGDLSRYIPKIQENYDAAIFYYERTASLIESIPNYPYGVHADLPPAEGNNYLSLRAPILLTILYYTGYGRALRAMLKDDVSYTDTIKVLENMRSAADRCLRRPSLSVWGARQSEITHSKQVICQARRDFAEKALTLEYQRIDIARQCAVPLNECEEHKSIFDQIVKIAREMSNTLNSVPAI